MWKRPWALRAASTLGGERCSRALCGWPRLAGSGCGRSVETRPTSSSVGGDHGSLHRLYFLRSSLSVAMTSFAVLGILRLPVGLASAMIWTFSRWVASARAIAGAVAAHHTDNREGRWESLRAKADQFQELLCSC